MKTLLLLLFCIPLLLGAAPLKIKPGVKTPTAFAIFIDRPSYDRTKASLEAYRDVVEKDGLATYIFVDDWSSPQQIREIIKSLYADPKMPLEGVVFVGDIPVPMIRDAQFMTSAFKMDQKRDWTQSSIPSDRYYDDFELQFDFIRRDSLHPLYFYYTLNPQSRMILRSEIYSARIKPTVREGVDKYALLDNYLKKVVRVRSVQNPLNDLTVARGHGYNSEAREAWSGEQLALREQFPRLFNAGNYVRFYDFDTDWPVKSHYLTAVQRADADVVLFHHHGAEDTQYLNGYKEGSAPDVSIENVRRYLRSKVQTAALRKKDVEKTIQDYMKTFAVPREWMADALDPKVMEQDSLYNLELDIYVSDIHAIKPNARFVMFDACYNGSFHVDDYIAGAYIFNDGNTIVTQGNTVNTIQDKWPDEFLGLLGCGLRVGQWGRHVHFLETHIIGDPTYRFANGAESELDINRAITIGGKDTGMWEKMLKNTHPDVQAMALRKLYECKGEKISSLLKETYETSSYGVVRMECMKLLFLIDNQDLYDVLKLAVDDSYELVRRFAVEYIGRTGADELIPALVNSLLNDNLSVRVNYKARDASRFMDAEKMMAEIRRQCRIADHWINKEERMNGLITLVERNHKSWESDIKLIQDHEAKEKDRLSEIVSHRNLPFHKSVEPLVAYVLDSSNKPDLRIAAIEALSWFSHSWERGKIIAACDKLIAANENQALVNEALKTRNRITPVR